MNAAQLVAATGCSPNGADHLADCLQRAMDAFGISTLNERAHFLAQTAFESGLYVHVEENLNYSAERLAVVFPKYFGLGKANPADYARQKDKIANLVYANRMGNGPPASGDGWKYRGRGYIQLTGRTNYTALNQEVPQIPCVSFPDSLCASEYAALSAAWFWDAHRCNAAANVGLVSAVTQKINGGFNGLAERTALTNRALAALKG